MDAFARQDAAGIGALYTQDCKIMPSGTDVLMGREGIYLLLANGDVCLCSSQYNAAV